MIRPASTVCALRDGVPGLEVLMVRRAGEAVFMGGAFVFPGGAVDAEDHQSELGPDIPPADRPFLAAAIRELHEEAGVVLSEAADLVLLDVWVTPPGPPRRFDTRFYVVAVPADTAAEPDGVEVTEAAWVTPATALANGDAGTWHVSFPTRVHLEHLAGFELAGDVVTHARSQAEVPRVEPRMVTRSDGSFTVLLPGDPGYEGVDEGQSGP